jgi:hypothetical protein
MLKSSSICERIMMQARDFLSIIHFEILEWQEHMDAHIGTFAMFQNG